jgi:hypothetical protein
MTTTTIFLSTGLACVIAAISGGGISYKDISIPKILSRTRQWLLGALGVALIALGLRVDLGALFLVLWLALMVGGLVQKGQRDQKYEKSFREHLGEPLKLVEDARRAFWEQDYKWTVKFMSQAKEAARDDCWQSGYAFLLGAQLALREKDAASTRIEIMNCIVKASKAGTGYFSSGENLHELKTNLAAVRSSIIKAGMTKSFTEPVRAEIDLVMSATQQPAFPSLANS